MAFDRFYIWNRESKKRLEVCNYLKIYRILQQRN